MASVQDRAKYYLVDKRGEGGLVSELDRVAMVDEPTLIIGLGGTGADALLNTKYVLHRKLKYPHGKGKPGRLAYLAIDTDASDLETKRVGDTRLSPGETCDITEPDLKAFMANHSLIPKAYMRDWLSNGIPPLATAFGASGIRQYGRFMLISKAELVAAKITEAVNSIWSEGKENGEGFLPENDKVNVYILTGIGGGTGSGTFLDVAYMVREIITKQMGMGLHLRVRGVIFLPEVNACKVKTEKVRAYLPVNGYAALKELDFWMNPERGRNFRQQYTDLMAVDTNETPFEVCFMVSPNGGNEEDYTTCMQTTGEAMLNILSGSEAPAGGGVAAGPQGFESYVNNLVKMLQFVEKPYAGNYIFSTMGMDERRLQLDQMATYIAYYLLQQVQGLFDREPIKEQVEKFCKDIKLDKKGMEKMFHQNMEVQPFPKVKDLASFKNAIQRFNHSQVLSENMLEQQLDMWAKQCGIFYTMHKDDKIKECAEMLANEIDKLFASSDYGPFYAHRMLHNAAVGKIDVLKTLKTYIEKLDAFLLTADNQRELKRTHAQKAKESAYRSRLMPLIAGAKYNEFVEAVFEQYDFERDIEFSKVLRRVYNELYTRAVDYNNLIVEKFVNLLNALTEVFKTNSSIITNVTTDGNNHNWNVVNFNKIQPFIDAAIKELENQGLIKAMVKEFLETMLSEREAWLDDNGDLGASFSRFVSEKFNHIMNMSLEQHYMSMLGINTEEDLKDYIRTKVLPQLRAGSKVMFQENTTLYPIKKAAERSMICYPAVAYNIGEAVKQYVATGTDLNGKPLRDNCDVVASRRSGSIFWFRGTFGMPLYCLSSVINYQTAYDKYGKIDKHLGRHLKMRGDDNWLYLLPPLMPDSIWDHLKYSNPAQAAKNEDSRAVFQKAWESGIILPMPDADGKFVVGCVDESEFNALLASAPLSEEDQKKISEQGAAAAASVRVNNKEVEAFLVKAGQFAQDGWKQSDYMLKSDPFLTLRGGVLVETNEGELRDRQILSENLLLTPDTVEKLRYQLELKQKLADVIAVHRTFTELGDLEKTQRSFFANCLFYGLYRKVGKLYQLNAVDEGVQAFVLMGLGDYALAPAGDDYYAMFRKFNTLPEEQKTVMQTVLNTRTMAIQNEIIAGNLARYEQCVNSMKAIDGEIAARINVITMNATYDHPEVLEFYKALRSEIALLV